MPLHFFFLCLSTDAYIRSLENHRIHCWILSDNVPHIQSLWKFFPWYIMPFVNPILWFGQPCSACELVIFTIEACGICFHDTLTGWTYTFLNMCEPESFHGSYSSGVFPDKTINFVTSSKASGEWKIMHWRSGSRPWTLCPWTRCRSYHRSFL